MRTPIILSLLSFTSMLYYADGQARDTLYLPDYPLEEVTVTASKLPENRQQVPFSIFALDSTMINTTQQNLSLKEHLRAVPGVYVQNAYNFAQDARISIRGFGATAGFGIRGIKLIVDGIPETTPDGSGQLDNLNLDAIQTIQVIRGSSSSLYGNASGGAILIQSNFDFSQNFLQSTSMIGSYNTYSQALAGGIKLNQTILTASVRLFGSDGFRDHNGFSQINSRVAARHVFNEKVKANFILEHVHSPEAQDAGGLTLDEVNEDFDQARDRNIAFDAGEEIRQSKFGMSFDWTLSPDAKLNSYAFINQRKFDGKIPAEDSGIIDLKRNYYGIGNSLNLNRGKHSVKAGFDFLSQIDDRKRFENQEGATGEIALNQEESFINLGWFALDYITLGDWFFSAGIRQDFNQLEAKDRLIENGDDSGAITITNWSYNLGIGRSIFSIFQVFANHSTNFETPTLNQLSNRPDNSGGFEDLKAADASSFEFGIRTKKSYFNAELVGFVTKTRNELVPFEENNRTFFENSGKIFRQGIELNLNLTSKHGIIYSSYTLSDFKYRKFIEDDQNLKGNATPGIPKHHLTTTLLLFPTKEVEISLPFNYVGNLWADNQNSVEIDDYIELSITARYQLTLKNVTLNPAFGIRNLTNQKYFDNIRINDSRGRYYEPAPKRNVFVMLTIDLH